MSGTRDLSGFGAPPTPPSRRSSTTSPNPPTRRKRRADLAAPPAARAEPSATASAVEATPTPSRPSKRRINLSLPVAIADSLRRYTEAQQTYYVDVILRAHALHRQAVSTEFAPNPSAKPRLRRRKPAGRVQIALTIEPDALNAIDRDADAVALDRSSYVAEVLLRYLGEGSNRKQ